eukprot:5581946-Prymnesium_polylepis.1
MGQEGMEGMAAPPGRAHAPQDPSSSSHDCAADAAGLCASTAMRLSPHTHASTIRCVQITERASSG